LTAGVIDALHDEIAAQRVVLYTEQPDNDLRVTGDPSVLQPLIAQLCRNEIVQALPGQRIALRVERHGNHVWVSVLGMGDKPAELSQEDARHMEAALAAAGGGFTLTPLHGQLAYVAMLPLRPIVDTGPQAMSVNVAAERTDNGDPLEGLFVMAIDDQEEARDALEAVLGTSGARVRLAPSGFEALDWLSATDTADWPNVLLCDIVLAGEDGYDVLRRLRALEATRYSRPHVHLPAIALTGHVETDDPTRAQTAGFDSHLNKPVAPARLIAEIARLAKLSAQRA
jgi:ATP-binding cassette subfamily B protein